MARAQGLIYVSTELGGGGTVTPWIKDLGEAGLKRCLKLLGTLPNDHPVEAPAPTRLCGMPDDEHYLYAYESGIFEPVIELGDDVEAGQTAAYIHFPEIPWRAPRELTFRRGGVVFCKRVPSFCEAGDCLFFLLPDYEA